MATSNVFNKKQKGFVIFLHQLSLTYDSFILSLVSVYLNLNQLSAIQIQKNLKFEKFKGYQWNDICNLNLLFIRSDNRNGTP